MAPCAESQERCLPSWRCLLLHAVGPQVITTMLAELTPTLFILLLAAGMLWIVWRLVRRLFRGRQEPAIEAYPEPDAARAAPAVRPVAASPSTIPDAADVLALKAAIDNLARQVAALENRLAAGQTSLPPRPVPSDRTAGPAPTIPSVSPDHRI